MSNVRSVRTSELQGPIMSNRWRSAPIFGSQRQLRFFNVGQNSMLGDYLGKSWFQKAAKSFGQKAIKTVSAMGPFTPLLAIIPGVGIGIAAAATAAAAAARAAEAKKAAKAAEKQQAKDEAAAQAAYDAEEKAYLESVGQQQAAVQQTAGAGAASAPSGLAPLMGGNGKGLPLIIGGAALLAGLLLFNKSK